MSKAEEILNKHLIGVNKEAIKKHHDFLPSILKAMEEYRDLEIEGPVIPREFYNFRNRFKI